MHFWYLTCSIYSLLLLHYSSSQSIKKLTVKGKIVGGRPVSLAKFPSAAIFFNSDGQCAGTILNSWTILTAAHCFDLNKDINEMVVEVGARYLYDFASQAHEVHSFVIHEDYNTTLIFACDIALIFLKKPIKFGEEVKKAILVTNDKWMSSSEKDFNAIGWGWTKYGGEVSDEGLMMTHLRFIQSEECSRLHELKFSPDMFCLYGDGTKDTCKGDSGGGIYWRDMIVGITSHGDGCARKDKPSVYANVWYFREWIQKQVENYFARPCTSTASY